MPSGPEKLTPLQLGELAGAALENSADLLGDATVLFALERYPRALSLAVLAAEEFGKHVMCISAVHLNDDDADGWRKFWRRFTWHEPKLTTWAGIHADFAVGGSTDAAADEDWKRLWDTISKRTSHGLESKLAGLYVDYAEGAVQRPTDEIDREDAERVLDAVHAVVRPTAAHFADVDMADFLDRTAEELSELIAAMHSDPKEFERLLRERFEGYAPEDAGPFPRLPARGDDTEQGA